MKVAGIREFRDHAPEFLGGRDLVFVTKHGKVSSLVVPLSKSEELPLELRRELLTRLGSAISGQLRKAGIREGTIENDFKAWRKSRRPHRRGR
ncbi:MAG TPA: hypothetical protein VJ873_10460 [bacterium]|nr:hypothetical protein [bacterium]